MISNGAAFVDFIDSILKPEGYIKKKTTWYKKSLECLCYFHIEKSPYGGYYDEAIGCFLQELNTSTKKFPPFHKDHMRYSLSQLAGQELLRRLLDLENEEFTANEREVLLKEVMVKHGIPFLKKLSTKAGIKEAAEDHKGFRHRIQGTALDLLSMNVT